MTRYKRFDKNLILNIIKHLHFFKHTLYKYDRVAKLHKKNEPYEPDPILKYSNLK